MTMRWVDLIIYNYFAESDVCEESDSGIQLKIVSWLQPPPAPTLNGSKRPRTAEDFLLFCKFILDYENYEMLRQAEVS